MRAAPGVRGRGGFTEPHGTRTGFGALLVGYYDNGALRYAARSAPATLQRLRATMDDLEQDDSPFETRVREPGAHWTRPELVAEAAFSEWTADGKLRHPRYQGLRTDKDPHDVIRERP